LKQLTDLEVMQRVQAGETNQVGTLYERHKTSLFKYFYRCSNDQAVSEDMVQNVFIKVIRYKDQFKGTGEFTYWLFRIARNTWLDSIKKNDPMYRSIDLDSTQIEGSYSVQASHLMTQQDQKERLKRALDMISPEKKDAIVMSRYHGMDYKTIAEISDCTENAIKSRVMRGIIEIKEIVKRQN